MKNSLEKLFAQTKPGDVGILGDPIGHSLSPLMHNAAFQTWWGAFRDRDEPTPHYHKFQVPASDLGQAIELSKKAKLRGLNITVPHKKSVCQFLEKLDPIAQKVEAVNTISLTNGQSWGYNTDGHGFKRAIEKDLDFDVSEKKALVLGAGGTGVVIVHVLLEMGAKVFWWNRHPQKVTENLARFSHLKSGTLLVGNDKELKAAMDEADLVVNATSVGLSPEDGLPARQLNFRPGQIVFDVIYHRETRYLQEAKAAGATVYGGLGMLVYQGARSFEIWTGAPAPQEVMWEALTKSLKGQ